MTLQEALRKARAEGDSQDARYVLGLVYLNIRDEKNAQELFKKMVAIDPVSVRGRWGLAEVMRRRHDLDSAAASLENIIRIDHGFSPAYISLAYIKYIKKDFEGAVTLANSVIRQSKGHVDTGNYARAYLLLAGAKGMIAHYGGPFSKLINGAAVYPNLKKAQSLEPAAPEVFFGLGCFYLLAPALAGGDIARAETYLKKAVEADPKFSDAYVRLAQLYKMKGDKEQYDRYLTRALEVDPGNELALDIQSGRCTFICLDKKE